MIATLNILDAGVKYLAATAVPLPRICDRMQRSDAPGNDSSPLCGTLAGRCLASGCPIAAMVMAAREARQAEAS